MRTPMTDIDRRLAARWGWPLPTMAGAEEPGDDPPPAKKDPPEGKEPEGKTVPVSELQKERQKRQDLEQQVADLREKEEERRSAEMSEVERLKEQVAQLTARAEKAETAVVKSERSQWIVDAAVEAGFEKPAAAVKLIDDVESLESSQAAIDAVKKVAKEYPGLLRSEQKGPNLERVLQDGKPPETTGDETLLTQEELNGMTPEKLKQYEQDKPGIVERSLAAVGT